MLCICCCTNSIKLHRLLLLDSGLCYSQAMDALHLLLYQIHQTPPAAFVGFRTVYLAKPWMLCICYCTNSIKVQQLGVPFYCTLMDFGGFGMVSIRNAAGLGFSTLICSFVLRKKYPL